MAATTNPASERTALAGLYRRMWRAMIAKDRRELEAVHADAFVLVHMTGLRQPKADYLRAVADGTLNYFSEQTERLQIEPLTADRARVTGESRVEAAVFGGGRRTWRLRLTLTAERCDEDWRFTQAVASTY